MSVAARPMAMLLLSRVGDRRGPLSGDQPLIPHPLHLPGENHRGIIRRGIGFSQRSAASSFEIDRHYGHWRDNRRRELCITSAGLAAAAAAAPTALSAGMGCLAFALGILFSAFSDWLSGLRDFCLYVDRLPQRSAAEPAPVDPLAVWNAERVRLFAPRALHE